MGFNFELESDEWQPKLAENGSNIGRELVSLDEFRRQLTI